MQVKFLITLMGLFLCLPQISPASQAGAEAIVQQHQAEMDTYLLKLKMAKSITEMRAALAQEPDAKQYSKRMIKEIGSSLKQGWTLKYSTWLIENTSLGKKDTKFLLSYATRFHLKSPDLARFCYAVTYSNSPIQAKKKFIDKALKNIKDKKQKGIASISLAVLLRSVGDGALTSEHRIRLIREAIILSADQKIGKLTVADIAKEELFRITHLSKGRPAPLIKGKDILGRDISLENYKGRVVMLVFWSSWDFHKQSFKKNPENDKLAQKQTKDMLDVFKKTEKSYLGRPFALIGINRDTANNLRQLDKSGLLNTTTITDSEEKIFNLYRVNAPPYCFVIDQKGIIRYSGQAGAFANLTVDALLPPKKAPKP